MSLEIIPRTNNRLALNKELLKSPFTMSPRTITSVRTTSIVDEIDKTAPEILFITSYPPRECGIATYSEDLIKALNNKFSNSFSINVCALEPGVANYKYPGEVKYILDTNDAAQYPRLAKAINTSKRIRIVLIQHEFGFFENVSEEIFLQFLQSISKPVVLCFHTVLPHPGEQLKSKVAGMCGNACESILVMTKHSADVLHHDYDVPKEKITVIAHGTHLVLHLNKQELKEKYGLQGKKVFSTFGLLGSGKSIETTLEALPAIINIKPDVVFLLIGKTHPGVVKSEGEKYRSMLEAKVNELQLNDHVRFINQYLPLQDLLEYLQLTDIYLFTSKDPNQAVSGTFAYAMSCACPIISTPIPHAREVLRPNTGIIIDFQNSQELATAILRLLNDAPLLKAFTSNTMQRIVPTAWENAAIAHALLLEKISGNTISLHYSLPAINLAHVKKMTSDFGMIQFSKLNQPDLDSGYTLDDNARALIALCMHYELTGDQNDIPYLFTYLRFIKHCQQPEGYFLNYVDRGKKFTEQNKDSNLADANGRAIWALGYLVSKSSVMPPELIAIADHLMRKALLRVELTHSTRSMAFAIKGLHYYNRKSKSPELVVLIKTLANRLVQMYRHESEEKWQWFEGYLTYANSIVPEALLCAWMDTGESVYKEIAQSSFDFLLSHTFNKDGIKIISNKSWMHKGKTSEYFGEQPIDVAYTILALTRFYDVFNDENYLSKMNAAFNWFLGQNHLHQIIYNPCTGGCYDGLEETHININQGAESTLSYLMARLTIEQRAHAWQTTHSARHVNSLS